MLAKKNIAFAVIIGSKEMEAATCVVKDLAKGEQTTVAENELLKYFNKLSLRF